MEVGRVKEAKEAAARQDVALNQHHSKPNIQGINEGRFAGAGGFLGGWFIEGGRFEGFGQ